MRLPGFEPGLQAWEAIGVLVLRTTRADTDSSLIYPTQL